MGDKLKLAHLSQRKTQLAMASGIAITEECKTQYQELKGKHKYHYIIYQLSPNDQNPKEVVVKHMEPRAADFKAADFPDVYASFYKKMEEVAAAKTCCFAVIDCFWIKDGGQEKNKIVFIYHAPESSPIKAKMVYSSTKDALLKALGSGWTLNLQATDFDELSWKDRVLKELMEKDKYA